MRIKIILNDKGNPKVADAELHFDGPDPLAGLKLIGFGVWEKRTGQRYTVTFPARQYVINGNRRSFALLRPQTDPTAPDALKDAIIRAYEDTIDPPPPIVTPPSPLESSPDAAAEHDIDAKMAQAYGTPGRLDF